MFTVIKSYSIFILLTICLLFAMISGTIAIKRQNGPQDIHTSLSKTFKMSDNQIQLIQDHPFAMDNWLSQLQEVSGELLISPKESWHRRSQIISSSKNFLHIWMYNITHKDSRTLIKQLAKDDVKVHMILEDDKYGVDQMQSPRGRGIQVRNDAKLHTNFVHAKVLVSDGFAMIQTANLTFGGFNDQREYYVAVKDPSVVGNLKVLFEKDREGAAINPDDIHPNILFCPIDCRAKTVALLQSAKESIYIQNQYIEDDEIIGVLQDKAQYHKHMDIKLILPKDDKNSKELGEDLQSFYQSGSLRLLLDPRIHAKAILVDHTYLLISSINLSQNSFDNNREIGIIITNKDAIRKFLDTFDDDRSVAN